MVPAAEAEPPFRIAIDVRPMSGPPCGFTIHLSSVIALLRDAHFDLTLLSNRSVKPEYEEIAGLKTLVFGSPNDLRWEHQDLPKVLGVEDFDLYFTDANRGIPFKKNPTTRYILGLLDIIPYKFPRQYFAVDRFHRLRTDLHRKETISQIVSVFRADAILTISSQSAKDIAAFFHRRNVTSCLIRLKDVALPTNLTLKNQFAYLGGFDYRKKVDVLLHAFARFVADHPHFQLFLVGSDRHYQQYIPLIQQLGLADRVVMTGYVDHHTKFTVLGESLAMIYPSLYEGYGLAIAEGLQAGIPVIAGKGGAQAEIGGNAVRYIDPNSAEQIDQAMREMLDPATRDGWIARGRDQLRVLTDPAIEAGLVEYFLEQGRIARLRRKPLHALA